VSLVFLSPVLGYTTSALLNDRIHYHFGQRGIAIMTSLCHFAAYVASCLHPPFPVLVVVYVLAGLGNGLEDAAWNAWVGVMANTNEMLGILHAFYGFGATLSPLIATSMITKAHLPWYTFYYLMIGLVVIEFVLSVGGFWEGSGAQHRKTHPRKANVKGLPAKEALGTLPAARTTWTMTAFLFIYVGVEVALGGWIVTFMITIRHASLFASGMTATGFWLGITIGRVTLGFVTPRVGEKRAITVCCSAIQCHF
jgi:fucose permease